MLGNVLRIIALFFFTSESRARCTMSFNKSTEDWQKKSNLVLHIEAVKHWYFHKEPPLKVLCCFSFCFYFKSFSYHLKSLDNCNLSSKPPLLPHRQSVYTISVIVNISENCSGAKATMRISVLNEHHHRKMPSANILLPTNFSTKWFSEFFCFYI